MDMHTLMSFQWSAMMPEFIILGIATFISLLDLFMKPGDRRFLGWIAFTGVVAAIVSVFQLAGTGEVVEILFNTFRLDSFAIAFKLVLLLGSGLIILLALGYEPKEGFSNYRGEFFYLFLAALLGAMIMVSSADLITMFVGLELLSISSYILAGMRKTNERSNEAAMKYVISGGISTAITLFGMSYIYGLVGSTNLADILYMVSNISGSDQILLMYVAFFLLFIGLSFKIGAAPFHMWAPDVYEGAPTPTTAFLSVVSKTAGFAIIVRLCLYIFANIPSAEGSTEPMLFALKDYMGFLAGATMIIGNVIALRQRNIKRMLAYSSIAHAGYVLVAFSTFSAFSIDAIWFYLVAYAFMTAGAFAIVQVVTEKDHSEDIGHLAGLYKRSPVAAVSLAIFLLSLAGLPGTAGFIGKVKIFLSAFSSEPGHYVLASILVATTVVSYVYYFGLLTQMFFRPAVTHNEIKLPPSILVAVVISVIGTILFGLYPQLAIDFFTNDLNRFADFFK